MYIYIYIYHPATCLRRTARPKQGGDAAAVLPRPSRSFLGNPESKLDAPR